MADKTQNAPDANSSNVHTEELFEDATDNDRDYINSLKQERGLIRGKLTRFTTFLNDEKNKENLIQIKTRLNKIESILEAFELVQAKIDTFLGQNAGLETIEFENQYYEQIILAREMLEPYEQRTLPPTRTVSQSNQISNPLNTQFNYELHNVRLPKLDLPSFNGNYHDWLNFFDTFKSIIHDNKQLADVQKLQYLRSCLKDEASKVIDSLETTSANYTIALDLLKERYDNRRIIIQSHIKTLMELPSSSKESSVNIRNLLDNMQVHLRALTALGEPVDKWDSLMIYIITSKLDRYTHREWEKGISGNKMPKLEDLLEFLRKRHQVLEASNFEISNKSQNGQSRFNNNNNGKRQTLASTNGKDYCNFCKDEHKIYSCDKFLALTVAERHNATKTAGLCFNCLRKGHRTQDCTLSNAKNDTKNTIRFYMTILRLTRLKLTRARLVKL